MDFSSALDKTLKEFDITARELAARSGVAESSISRFRRGERDMHCDGLERLLAALPVEARNYFVFNCLVPTLGDGDVATLLSAIAHRLKQNESKADLIPV
ncbi:helix-turn-helix transcriptional regulator [bacterium]|nr:helix-turn-helix transcriptional regulator [bacterium]